ncbi:MAG: hypothetical protein WCO82_01235, partial [Sphingomonadales bacterium]
MTNRRRLLAAAAATPFWANWAARAAAHDGEADLLLTNARIITMDPARPRASAMAVKAGRIMAIGGDELKSLAGSS